MYRSEYIVCFRSEISFVPLLSSHRTPFLRPYWQIYFNSTSNHNVYLHAPRRNFVVSYFNSTSNHNWILEFGSRTEVVSYFNSTSNHNAGEYRGLFRGLFLISILHQTTTYNVLRRFSGRLFLISILHQTTTKRERYENFQKLFLISILHQTTTHSSGVFSGLTLFLISILHQTTTYTHLYRNTLRPASSAGKALRGSTARQSAPENALHRSRPSDRTGLPVSVNRPFSRNTARPRSPAASPIVFPPRANYFFPAAFSAA